MDIEKSCDLISNKKLTTDQVMCYILKEIEYIESRKITKKRMMEEQERTWLKFYSIIPLKVKKEIPPLVKEKTGYRIKWLKDNCLVIDFFSEEKLAEIRHCRTQTKDIESLKAQPKKKRREIIPKPKPKNTLAYKKHSKTYNEKKKSSSSTRSKSSKNISHQL